MNDLLIFFALPIATIIFSIVLQRLIGSSILTALTIFASFLIVAFLPGNEIFLVLAIVYGILAYVTAIISRFIRNYIVNNSNDSSDNSCGCNNNGNNSNINDDSGQDCGCNNRNYINYRPFLGRRNFR